MSLFIAWTILLNYFLSKFFVVSLRFLCLVFVQDIDELFSDCCVAGYCVWYLRKCKNTKENKRN